MCRARLPFKVDPALHKERAMSTVRESQPRELLFACPFVDHTPSTACAEVTQDERELATMLIAFRPGGGVVSGEALANLLRPHHDQPISVVARWLVGRRILSIDWRGQTLIPLFQFDRHTMKPRSGVFDVIRELADAFDDWEMNLWFATPSSWLAETSPVSMLDSHPAAVLQAARTDRYVALG
jgi:hypothetical protein